MPNEQKPDQHRIITESMLLIERGIRHPINIDSVIENSTLSNADYLKFFTQYAHESPEEFQTRLRTERALLLLLIHAATIDTVSKQCGFQSHHDFIESFLKRFHQDPVEMMEQQNQHHNLISFNADNTILTATEQTISSLNDEIQIKECAPLAIQYLRHIGPYNEAYKAWLGLIYRAGTKYALNPNVSKIGLSLDFPSITQAPHLRYEAGLSLEKTIPTLLSKSIAGGLYAIYEHTAGPASVDAKISEILQLWLPGSAYRLRDEPLYYRYSNFGSTAFKMKQIGITIHIPITKKSD